MQNIATVRAVCATLGDLCPARAVDAALANFRWAGRFDLRGDLLLDGAHNPAGMRALLAAIDREFGERPVHAVFSALADKRVGELLGILRGRAASVRLCPTSSRRSLGWRELAAFGEAFETVEYALEDARNWASRDGGLVLVTGSLFLVGDVMALEPGVVRDPAVDG